MGAVTLLADGGDGAKGQWLSLLMSVCWQCVPLPALTAGGGAVPAWHGTVDYQTTHTQADNACCNHMAGYWVNQIWGFYPDYTDVEIFGCWVEKCMV